MFPLFSYIFFFLFLHSPSFFFSFYHPLILLLSCASFLPFPSFLFVLKFSWHLSLIYFFFSPTFFLSSYYRFSYRFLHHILSPCFPFFIPYLLGFPFPCSLHCYPLCIPFSPLLITLSHYICLLIPSLCSSLFLPSSNPHPLSRFIFCPLFPSFLPCFLPLV